MLTTAFQVINKYLSSENKLLHACKDHLKVTKEAVKTVKWINFTHYEQKYPFRLKMPSFNKLELLHLCSKLFTPYKVLTNSKQIIYKY